jgi:hypothetical protein
MPIIKFNDPEFSAFIAHKVCRASEVEEACHKGWRLLAVILPDPEPPAPPSIGMGPWGPMARYRDRQEADYLMGRDEASVVAAVEKRTAESVTEAIKQRDKAQAAAQRSTQAMYEEQAKAQTAKDALKKFAKKIAACKTIDEAQALAVEVTKTKAPTAA